MRHFSNSIELSEMFNHEAIYIKCIDAQEVSISTPFPSSSELVNLGSHFFERQDGMKMITRPKLKVRELTRLTPAAVVG
jgi:hypothetical protein